MTFDELIRKLTDHLKPWSSELAERLKFHQRDQDARKTVTVYVPELRTLTIHFDFGDFILT